MSFAELNRRTFLGGALLPVVAAGQTSVSAQTASSETLNLADYELVFEDHFDQLNLNKTVETDNVSPTGWVPEASDGPNPAIEVQRYIDPRDPAMKGHTPFSVANSVLTIEANLTPSDIAGPAVNNRSVISGLIMTKGWFRQQYGYIEGRMKMPKGASGNWPCFWALSDSGAWPPEIDVLEQVSTDTSTAFLTIHGAPYPPAGKTQVGQRVRQPDLSADFHTFGVDWQPDALRYFIDGKHVWTARPINGVHAVEVTSGGSGYTEPPTVKAVGGGGRDCELRAEVSNGQVSRILIANSGTGYTSAPRIVIEGRGRGAVARASVANDPAVPVDFHTPMYIILNFSLGGPGSWTGETNVSPAHFPRRFEIDYVRVYRRKIATPPIVQGRQEETTAVLEALKGLGAPMTNIEAEKANELVRELKSWKLRHDTKPFADGRTEWDVSALSLWQAMDGLYIFAVNDERAALLNWAQPRARLADVSGSPSFTARRGFVFKGAPGEFIETHVHLGDSRQFRVRDNHVGVWLGAPLENEQMAAPIGVRGVGILMSRSELVYQVASPPPARGLKVRPVSSGHVVAARGPYDLTTLFHDGQIWHVGAVYRSEAIKGTGETLKIGSNAPAAPSVKSLISAAHWGRRLMPDEVTKLREILGRYLEG